METTIKDFVEQADPHFVERIRKIFPSDEEVVEWLNRPFMGFRGEPTVWERLTTESSFGGFMLDMTCSYPVVRSELPAV